ncbi:Rhomboid protease GlpG [Rubripirellula amarantea]|uniref:Rhomboid protease GlpG n=1 Tax=Rubripirellula amarantea TaxID=2527999 RepID=A0A5C5WVW0_9BACT|nr:rhomboid family intramembrane serine protease [Rubripirellula amarantea]TWT53982.1 Rhomboid protease GlpG [Rubripirellula amarantea]
MRRIGTLDNSLLARRFVGYLHSLSIDAFTDLEDDNRPDGAWNLWVRDESETERSRLILAEFRDAPEATKFQVEPAPIQESKPPASRSTDGEMVSARQDSGRRSRQANEPVDLGESISHVAKQSQIPITIGIIALSVVLSLATNFNKPRAVRGGGGPSLEEQINEKFEFITEQDFRASDGDFYASVRSGQVWRFITPMFLHGDEYHLAFNMLWLFFLGSAIERLHGSIFFAILVLVTQLGGMALQVGMPDYSWVPDALVANPRVIGASGAVYGLFAFLWIRPLVQPSYPIRLVPMNVIIMLVWLVVCMTPLIPNVANGAHLGGLLAGMIVGAMKFVGRL